MKHTVTSDALKAVRSLHAYLTITNDALAYARENLSDARYREQEAAKLAEFRSKREEALGLVQAMRTALHSQMEQAEQEQLARDSVNPFYTLLGSGASLSAHELALMLKKEPGSALLLRSVRAWAESHGLDQDKELLAALGSASQAQHSAHPAETIDRMADYLTNYAPQESDFGNARGHQTSLEAFERIAGGSGSLIESLDASI